MRDLALLVADKNAEYAMRGALGRPSALGIRQVDYQVLVEQGRDGGVRSRGCQLLNALRAGYSHALMILDHEGSGTSVASLELEASLDEDLGRVWGDRGKAIVIEPEVDVWMWGDETHLRSVVGWRFREGIRDWLARESFAFGQRGKPVRPKEALEAVFFRANVPRSSACYQQIASRISLQRCQDPAFVRMRASLTQWFGDGLE